MSTFWNESLRRSSATQPTVKIPQPHPRPPRCRDFLQFLYLLCSDSEMGPIGLTPVMTGASSQFSDVSMGGVSFDVRRVKTEAFPHGLRDDILRGREYLVVKQPRRMGLGADIAVMDEIATELAILTRENMQQNANIVNLCGVVWHNSGSQEAPHILPALVMEFADFGNLASFQDRGLGHTPTDKFDILQDIGEGLYHLHQCGIVHGDVKALNMLVCKHPTRTFVVKLSDFGFAMALGDEEPRLIGYTQHLEAPESETTLVPSLLIQLDIYSYGLLVHSVMKNGAMYYEKIPEADRPKQVKKLKESNLLPSMLQMNLLATLKGEKCLLLIFCKILAYCLRSDASERFANMQEVLRHLKQADPRDLDPTLHAGDKSYQLSTFKVSYYQQKKDDLMKCFDDCLTKFYVAVKGRAPMMDALKDMYRERMMLEVDMIMKKPTDIDIFHYTTRPGLELTLWRFQYGITVYAPPAGGGRQAPSGGSKVQASPVSRPPVQFKGSPFTDLSKHNEILKKMPAPVQLYIYKELDRLSKAKEDCDDYAGTLFNLGYCYIDGIGSEVRLENGLNLVEESARLGCLAAQAHILNLYSSDGLPTGLDQETVSTWCQSLVETGDTVAFCVGKLLSAEIQKRLCKYTRQLLVSRLADTPAEKISQRPRMTWRMEVLQQAAIHNTPEVIEEILKTDAELVDSRNYYGQTLLTSACQAGSIDAALCLLRLGADVNLRDDNGFGPLHWLISSHGMEKIDLLTAFANADVKPDLVGFWPPTKDTPLNLIGAPRVNGTALHWAIASGDMAAVKWLISMGADTTKSSAARTSALDFACELEELEILQELLKDDKTRQAVSSHRVFPAPRSSITVNAMFWVVSGGSRFDRLVRHGREFERRTEEVIKCLVGHGASCEAVLTAGPLRMSAAFATAYHHCNADIMRSGLANGFLPYVNSTFGGATSGGPAMSLAIAQKDREMFRFLVEAGASVTWRNIYKQDPLGLAAKEVDDIFFAEQLLERGAPLDDPDGPMTAFSTAVYCGNLNMAKYLWKKGADRDARAPSKGLTTLGRLIGLRTKNATDRISFILNLPDRYDSDGFETFCTPDIQHRSSALHMACSPYHSTAPFSEDPESEETCRLTLSLLLRKYKGAKYIDSTMGPHHDVPLGLAVEIGNHYAVRLLLNAGANPNAQDEYGRTPLDKLYWRYCFPATLDVIKEVRDDRRKVIERLSFVNQNTSVIYGLLQGQGAKSNVFRFPGWHTQDSEYRTIDWVMARLQENAERQPVDMTRPMWGDMPITRPENPMQWDETRRLAELRLTNSDKAESARSDDESQDP